MTDRFTSIKHAEFELLMWILRETPIQEWAEAGVPGIRSPKDADDEHALKRARSALQNVRKVILNMAARRVPFLPEGHVYEGWDGDRSGLIPPADEEWD